MLTTEDDPYLTLALNGSEATGTTFRSEGETVFDNAGYYEGVVGSGESSGIQMSLMAPTGEVFVVLIFDGETTESGIGMIDAEGNLLVVTDLDTELSGNYDSAKKLLIGDYERKGEYNTGQIGFFNLLDPADETVQYAVDRLKNISTRVFAGQNDSSAIAGFIIEGDAPKTVLVTAKGWDLRELGFENFLLD